MSTFEFLYIKYVFVFLGIHMILINSQSIDRTYFILRSAVELSWWSSEILIRLSIEIIRWVSYFNLESDKLHLIKFILVSQSQKSLNDLPPSYESCRLYNLRPSSWHQSYVVKGLINKQMAPQKHVPVQSVPSK